MVGCGNGFDDFNLGDFGWGCNGVVVLVGFGVIDSVIVR